MRFPRSGQLRVLRKCSEAAASSVLSDRLQQDVSCDNSSLSGADGTDEDTEEIYVLDLLGGILLSLFPLGRKCGVSP